MPVTQAQLSRSGTITHCDQNTMTATLDSPSHCARCASGKGCGAGVFGLLFQAKSSSAVFPRQPEIGIGDRVRLDISASAALRMAFIGYCLPVIGMILFAMICQYFISPQALYIAISGFLGLFVGLIGGLIAYSVLSGSARHQPGRAMRITQIETGTAKFVVN